MTQARPEPVIAGDRTQSNGGSPASASASLDRLNLLVYGGPGVGKTFLAGTAEDDPRTAPVLYCDFEQGGMTIDWRGDGLQFYPVTNFAADMDRLVKMFENGAPIFEPTGEPFRTVVIDSLTESAWRTMMGMVYDNHRAKNVRDANPDALEYGEWNSFTNRLRNFIMYFRDVAKVHLIMTALERTDDGVIQPALPGKQVSSNLPAFFNTVARLMTVPATVQGQLVERRRLLLQKGGNYVGKDRSDRMGLLPRFMDEPTVTKLLDRIEEGRRVAIDEHRKRMATSHE